MPRALFYDSQMHTGLHEVESRALTNSCDCRVRTLWSGISRGTERLVFEGRVPASEYERMRAPFQEGDFPFPVKYGYAAVGLVEVGPPDLRDRPVFCLFPHQDEFAVPAAALTPLPAGLPPRRAVLAANMETALNGLWDSGLGPGDRIAIVGGGVLGGLVAGLAASIPGTEVTLVDIDRSRASLAAAMGAAFSLPEDAPRDCDVVIHTSASEAGAITALGCGGDEARIVELSWFGDGVPALPLGAAFHARRLTYLSSQVGQIAPSRRPRWSHARRLAKALDLLRAPKFDALITGEVAFDELPAMLPAILAPGAEGLATAVRYGD